MGTQAIPLGKDDFVAGGLLSAVDVETKSVQFTGGDNNGNLKEEVLAVRMEIVVLDEHGKRTGETVEQYLSCGPKLEELSVAADGYSLMPGTKTALTKNSNFELWLESCWKFGMPADYIRSGNIKALEGLRWHLVQLPAPKREGLTQREGKTYMAVNRFLAAPWIGKPGTKGKGAPAGAAAQAPAQAPAQAAAPAAAPSNGSAVAGDAESKAQKLVIDIMTDLPKYGVDKIADVGALKVLAFRAMQDWAATDRNVCIKMIGNAEWLTGQGLTIGETGVTL